jgi:hypothetical protein
MLILCFIDAKIYKVEIESVHMKVKIFCSIWTWDKEETNDQKMHIQLASTYNQREGTFETC